MGLLVYYVDDNLTFSPLLNLILSTCTGIVIYLLMIFLLRKLRNKEIQGLLTIKINIVKGMMK